MKSDGIMKKILLFLIVYIICMPAAMAQGAESKVFIQVMQPDYEVIPSEASRQLETKMEQLIATNGVADNDPYNRFVLTSKAAVITKDIVPGPPAKVSMNIDFTFIIGDVVENKVFESVTVSCVGVGINENKAFIAAIKNVKPKNPELVAFLHKAKEKIVSFYSLRCSQIKSDAMQAAASQDYDEAIYMLMQVPDVCDCAGDCLTLAIQYNRDRVNVHAQSLLNQAKARWAESPNAAGASAAADLLAQIPGGTSCQQGVDALAAEIDAKLRADEKRDWEFKMQQYRDQVEKQRRDDAARLEQQRADNAYRARQQKADNEHRAAQQAANNEYRRTQQAADNAARSQLIEACRQVGLEYAKNQPKSVTYQKNIILW